MVENKETTHTEKHKLGVNTSELLELISKHVYSTKDTFLREAVCNASDALTKLFTSKEQLEKEGYKTCMYGDLKIEIIPDKENKTLIIKDNGIGMTKDDLINYLGSIATSGTAKFRELIDSGINKENADTMIGKFGIGFYSLFLVAARVEVATKSVRDRAYLWKCDGTEEYSIEETEYDQLHGTTVFIRLREGEEEFLNSDKLIDLIKKHMMNIKYPIGVQVEKEVEEEKEEKKEGEETVVEEIKEEVKKKKVQEMKIVNSEVNVWKNNLNEIPVEELQKFYKQLSNDYEDYLAVESFNLQGIVAVKMLIFFPKKSKINFFQKPSEMAENISIFNNNVLITKKLNRDIAPEWMDFVHVAVSSPDFSLNISREFLQGKSALNILKNKLPKCIASMASNLVTKDKEAFDILVKEFAPAIKRAVRMTSEGIQKSFAQLLRYPTNKSETAVSLEEYCNTIEKTEKQILYLTALSMDEVKNSIYLDGYKDRTVLLMGDVDDEIMLQGFKKFNDLPFQNISAEGVLGVDGKLAEEEKFTEFEEFTKKIQEILKEKVEKVLITKNFSNVPASIITTSYGHSSTMEQIIKANSASEKNMMVQMMLQMKKIFIISHENDFIKMIKKEFDEGNMEKVEEYVKFLHQAISVGCGFPVEEKNSFIRSLFKVISKTN
ncbi:hypothetical protein NUSPORA_00685 [Nucleospora cyclopteri]